MRTAKPFIVSFALLLCAGLFLWLCGPMLWGLTQTVFGSDDQEGDEGTALGVLQTLDVEKPEGEKYDEDLFRVIHHEPWIDQDNDGCVTSGEVMSRDLEVVEEKGSDCFPDAGVLSTDPYTGDRVEFEGGHEGEVAVDQVVSLKDACEHGLCDKDDELRDRVAFANDPYNLLTVAQETRDQKGSQTIDSWRDMEDSVLDDGRVCEYAAHVVGVKDKYDLSLSQGEYDELEDVLSGCDGVPVPSSDRGAWGMM